MQSEKIVQFLSDMMFIKHYTELTNILKYVIKLSSYISCDILLR